MRIKGVEVKITVNDIQRDFLDVTTTVNIEEKRGGFIHPVKSYTRMVAKDDLESLFDRVMDNAKAELAITLNAVYNKDNTF